MAASKTWCRIKLDSRNCLTLQQILGAFSAPISEQHAWAVTYQAVKCLDKILKATDNTTAKYMAVSRQDIIIHNDGAVHADTFLSPGIGRKRLTSEVRVLEELGMVVYEALDHTMPEESQRKLTTDLEIMLETMTDVNSDDEGDEGIDDSEGEVMEKIVELCRKRLEIENQADEHYSSVCRALVSEALEISSFMEKVRRSEASSDEQLMKLGLEDWSSIWQQLMQELRNGIKLKKVDYSKTATEFELTPYEMLMDDIRTRKAKLNPVKVPPKVRIDAKNEILEFIRSRPPLKSASLRVLSPRPDTRTPVEKLLEEIRGGNARKSLRKSKSNENEDEKSAKKNISTVKERRLIDLDEEIVRDLLNFEIGDENDCDSPNCKIDLMDLSTPPVKAGSIQKTVIEYKNGISKLNQESSEHSPFGISKSVSDGNLTRTMINFMSTTSLGNQGLQSPVTLEELCHIQVQLDSAFLASMDAKSLKDDLTKGNVCFRCRKTRFGIFTWSTKCFICNRLICSKCLTSVVLPNNDIPPGDFISPKEKVACSSICSTSVFNSSCCSNQSLQSSRSQSGVSSQEQRIFQSHDGHQLSVPQTVASKLLPCSISPGSVSWFGSTTTSSGKCKIIPGMVTFTPPIVAPTFKRSKTINRTEGSNRKAKIQLAMTSHLKLKQYVCKSCNDMMTDTVRNETFNQSDLCQKDVCSHENLI